MNTVTILWSSVAGAALTMAGAHGALWILDRHRLANLAFSVVALAVAGLSIAELGMMHSASAREYGAWVGGSTCRTSSRSSAWWRSSTSSSVPGVHGLPV